jgi:hypothetical protein
MTRPVTLALDVHGVHQGPYGGFRAWLLGSLA